MINYGFIAPKIEPDHYVLGGLRSLPPDILQASGQWDAYMPTYEPQFGGGWDTDGCTVWGTLNAIEFLSKKIFGGDPNFSERYIYNLVPVRPPGSDPHKVAEVVRGSGLIDNDKLPMTLSFEEFCEPTPMTQEFIDLGQTWLEKAGFGHEWVFKDKLETDARVAIMKEALTYSPLGVSVTAWFQIDGIYVDQGQANCHWCVCFGWDEEKRAWKIFDSYDQTVKLYSWDSAIDFCKRYAFAPSELPVDPSIPAPTRWQKFVHWVLNYLYQIWK